MRISSQTLGEQFLASIDQLQSALSNSEQQISTGLAFQDAGQNPIAATEAVTLTSTLAQITQYASNANLVQSRLSIEDSTLGSVSDLLSSVRSLAVQAGNSTLSASDRASLATEVSQKLQSLLQLANTQDGSGQYLFAGTATTAQPFVQDSSGAVAYQGNSGTRQIQIGSARFVGDTDSGATLFTQVPNGNGTFVTTPAAGNSGSGVVGATGLSTTAAYTGDSYRISFQSPLVTAGASNTGTATVSAPTGANTPSPAPPPTTITFLSATSYTLTSAGVTSAPQTLPANGQITDNGWTVTVSGTPAAGDTYTVAAGPTYSVTDTTTGALVVPPGAPYTSGQTIAIPGAGAEVAISGTPANGDSFSIAPSSPQSVFATLANLASLLNSPASTPAQIAALQSGLNQSLGAIDQAVNSVLAVRTAVGARSQAVTGQNTINSNVQLQLQKSLTAATSTDYAAAITNLSQEQVSLQAAEQSYAGLKSLSIFQYL